LHVAKKRRFQKKGDSSTNKICLYHKRKIKDRIYDCKIVFNAIENVEICGRTWSRRNALYEVCEGWFKIKEYYQHTHSLWSVFALPRLENRA